MIAHQLMAGIKFKHTGELLHVWALLALGPLIACYFETGKSVEIWWWLRSSGHYLDRNYVLQLLLAEQILPVLVLALELLVGTLDSSFLLLEFMDFFFKYLHLVAFLYSTPHRAFSILEAPKLIKNFIK